MRDEHAGDDRPLAFVTLRPGSTATGEELCAHCRRTLASFKVPDHVEILAEFPATANGDKIRKDRLREIAWSSPDTVVVHGMNLVDDVLGKVNLAGVQRPSRGARRARAHTECTVTRMTHLGAPESLQGAVAAGLPGLGSTFVGTMEGAAN